MVSDLEDRSRRQNLIFQGIHSSPNDDPKILVENFLKNQLKLDITISGRTHYLPQNNKK